MSWFTHTRAGRILLSLLAALLAAGIAAVASPSPATAAVPGTAPALAGADLAAPDAADAAPPGAYNIWTTFPCQCYNGQQWIAYRVGYFVPPDTGFGRAKVLQKHNMYAAVVGFIVKGPNHTHVSGTSGKAVAYAGHIVNGRLVQVLQILAAYDVRVVSQPNRSFGIVTAYCVGIQGFCPQWVNEAINANAQPLNAAATNQPDSTVLSYDPASS